MKNIFFILFTVFMATLAQAKSSTFDHTGIQKGAISESCYHNPCSVAKVMEFNLLESNEDYHILQLNVVGGTKPWESRKVAWNKYPHNIYVTCSLKSPTVQIGDYFTTLPINSEYTVPGILYSTATLYLKACHNFDRDATEAAAKYGYDVNEDW